MASSKIRSDFGAPELCDLHRHQADARTGALESARSGWLRAVGDDRMAHGGGARLAGWRRPEPCSRGGTAGRGRPAVSCERSAAGAHDLVADLDALCQGPSSAISPAHSIPSTVPAPPAMDVALGHAEVGAVEAAGMDADQHLVPFGAGLATS